MTIVIRKTVSSQASNRNMSEDKPKKTEPGSFRYDIKKALDEPIRNRRLTNQAQDLQECRGRMMETLIEEPLACDLALWSELKTLC